MKWLHELLSEYNASYNTPTQSTPFRLLYGRDFRPILRYEKGGSLVLELDQMLGDHDVVLDDLKMHLLHAQQKMKTHADSKRHREEF